MAGQIHQIGKGRKIPSPLSYHHYTSTSTTIPYQGDKLLGSATMWLLGGGGKDGANKKGREGTKKGDKGRRREE